MSEVLASFLYIHVGLSKIRVDILIWVFGILFVITGLIALVVQIRRHRRLKAELQLLDSLKRHDIEHELVLKAMKLATWRIDARERLITLGSDFRTTLDNYIPMPGTPISQLGDVIAPWDARRVLQAFDDICSGRVDNIHLQYQMHVSHSDKMYWCEDYATVAERDADGKPLTVIGTSMRIDEQKELEAELILARNKAEESDRLKSAFLANISHEVRTPLNAIVGFSDILPMAQNEEERAKLVGIIRESNAKLLRIFDDIVSMSKIEAGNAELTITEFDLNQLLSGLASKYAAANTNADLVISAHTAGGFVALKTDRSRLTDILTHFMSNAVKFTEKGSITLGSEQETDGKLRIWVRDTGKGIQKDERGHIFDRFVKLDEFAQGTGLGLSICRSLAYSLGGTVGVDSEVGVGSTFWVELPVDR